MVANDYQNTDLYWALRGGGGGTFGVVVSVTLKTFPEPPVVFLNLNVTFPDIKSMFTWCEAYLKAFPSFADAGGSGYSYVDPAGIILRKGTPTVIVSSYWFNHIDTAAINQLYAPLVDMAHGIKGTTVANLTLAIPQARYILPQPYGSDGTGHNDVLGSRLLSRDLLEEDDGPARVVAAFANISANLPQIFEVHLTAGGQVARNAHLVDSAINPSWRKALGQIIVGASWADNATFAEQLQLQEQLTTVQVPQLAALDPEMGAYSNEADANEPHWQKVFWGANYPRLLTVKNKWDPAGFFRCNRCVGSERWNSEGNCPSK